MTQSDVACNVSVVIPQLFARSLKGKNTTVCHPDPALWRTAIIGIPAIGALLVLSLLSLATYALFSRRRRNRTQITQNQGIPL